eukprot:7153813-Pyramimonas_sp.AAC.1
MLRAHILKYRSPRHEHRCWVPPTRPRVGFSRLKANLGEQRICDHASLLHARVHHRPRRHPS